MVAAIVVIGIVAVSLALLPSKAPEHAEQVVKAASATPALELSKPEVRAVSVTHPVATSKPKPAAPVRPVEPAKSEVTVTEVPATTGPPETGSELMHVDLEAREPAWVSITDVDGKHLYAGVLQANETRSIDLTKGATLRTGNAGGLIVRFNGKEIGDIGPVGKIRDVEFQNGAFRIL